MLQSPCYFVWPKRSFSYPSKAGRAMVPARNYHRPGTWLPAGYIIIAALLRPSSARLQGTITSMTAKPGFPYEGRSGYLMFHAKTCSLFLTKWHPAVSCKSLSLPLVKLLPALADFSVKSLWMPKTGLCWLPDNLPVCRQIRSCMTGVSFVATR